MSSAITATMIHSDFHPALTALSPSVGWGACSGFGSVMDGSAFVVCGQVVVLNASRTRWASG